MKTILISKPDMLISMLLYDHYIPQYTLYSTTNDPDTVEYMYRTSCRETLIGTLCDNLYSKFGILYKDITIGKTYKLGFFCIPYDLRRYIVKLRTWQDTRSIESCSWRTDVDENLVLEKEKIIQKIQTSSNIINIVEEELGWDKSSINMCKIKYTDSAKKDYLRAKYILKDNELDYIPVSIIEESANFLISSQTLSLYLLLARLPLSELGYNIYKYVDSFNSLMGAIEEHWASIKHGDEKIFIEHYRYWLPFLKNIDYIYKDLSFSERFNINNSAVNKSGIYDLTSKQFHYCSDVVESRYREIIKL